MKHRALVLAVAITALALSGCASIPAPATSAQQTPSPAGGSTATVTTSPTSTEVFPSGQPPRPGVQDSYAMASTVPGLSAAIANVKHPGLQICGGKIGSVVTAKGDLRGNGGTQYLVDTTCEGATATSPDEVSLYDVHADGSFARSAVIYEFTANRPRTTAYPYMWKDHTVVLTYSDGTEYRLVRLTPAGVIPGLVQPFH